MYKPMRLITCLENVFITTIYNHVKQGREYIYKIAEHVLTLITWE